MLTVNMETRHEHWQKIYSTKQPNEVSWTQAHPKISLDLIHESGVPKSAKIIDIGGGDSRLVDHLLGEGYDNITVLDISEQALARAKARLGERASKVTWIASDVTEFQPTEHYDLWHDRAAFHFLTDEKEIANYVRMVQENVNGHLIIGTFSDTGPLKCSGLEVHRYSEDSLTACFSSAFRLAHSLREDHTTPFGTQQNFVFCLMARK
jgi:2-polyprenyl-3-methyl-5-hydroxy-6-metoxy-1,4-benzoquinol methylase